MAAVVLLLLSQSPALDEPALEDFVRVYLRDLGYEVRSEPGAPSLVTPESLGRVAQIVRERSARLAFWCQSRRAADGTSEIVLYTIDDRGEPHALPVVGVHGGAIHRVVALKVRAVLTGRANQETNEPVPPPAPPPPSPVARAAPPVGATPTVEARPSVAIAPRSEPPAALHASPPYKARVWIGAGYRVVVPLDTSLIRHNAYLDLALPIRWIEPHVGVEVGSDPTLHAGDGGSATLYDVPIRVGVRARLQRGRWGGVLGPTVSIHILHADGTGGDRTSGDATRAAAGLGIELGGELRLTDHVAVQVGGLFEYLLPSTHFQLHGATILDIGGTHFGVSAGLAFAAP